MPSKQTWIEKGEKNTKFFLSLEKSRAQDNTVDSLKQEGKLITDQCELLNMQTEYFRNLYRKKVIFEETKCDFEQFIKQVNIPKLSYEEKQLCEGSITAKEATDALRSMKLGSSPGYDGITTEFLLYFWNDIQNLLLESYNTSYLKGNLSVTQRRGIITLLHEGKQLPRSELNSWRPITLTNSDYKLLAKCFARRLLCVINSIINQDQVGYIPGRNISHILRLIDDVIEISDNMELEGAIVALDYRKAYDSISKEFIIHCFKIFGFGNDFINWISTLMSGAESSIQHSRWLSAFFPVDTGIRQGCPFSPLAFVVAVEILVCKIRQAKHIKGLNLPLTTHTKNVLKNV